MMMMMMLVMVLVMVLMMLVMNRLILPGGLHSSNDYSVYNLKIYWNEAE